MNKDINLKLYNYLNKLNIIDSTTLLNLFNQSKSLSSDLSQLLLQRELINDDDLGRILSEIYNIPLADLTNITVDYETLNIIPEIVAKKQMTVVFLQDKNGISVATSNPADKEFIDFVTKKVGKEVKVYYATKKDINEFFVNYRQNIEQTFDEILGKYLEQAKQKEKFEVSIVKIVDTLINYAYQNKASDIHIEPYEDTLLIRFRIDGVLHDVLNLPIKLHEQIIFRIKVLSKLKTDEHLSAQDGKMQAELENETLDIRVSIVPIVEGEKAVLRLLSSYARQFSLKELGMSDNDLKTVLDSIKKSTGMVLATGPTGCGKTTTIYAILKILNTREVNISTIEDPVEYDIEGVNQIQVNNKTNLNFAHGLKSILRQDPNIILVGEIRDDETADIAVNSALTGHLVLSTLHTNDAATTLPRLIDMKIEPFLVSSTVNLIIAQRLVRKICTNCKTTHTIKLEDYKNKLDANSIKSIFGTKNSATLYIGNGCSVCHDSGYSGRIGVFEILKIDDEISTLIMNKTDSDQIKKIAVQNGMTTMFNDATQKVISGLTTIDEIIKNIKSD